MIRASGYASALFAIASEKDAMKKYHKDSRKIKAAIGDWPEFTSIVSSTKLSKEKRKEILVETFKGKINKDYLNAMCLMVDNNHFHQVGEIFKQLNISVLTTYPEFSW